VNNEGIRLVRNNPRNEGTTQWRQLGLRYEPLNELAHTICDLAGWSALPSYKREHVEKLGFAFEVRP
jgi:hypothetical protein